ncbi:MAG: cell division protein ZapE [Gammaproteobacteria bacterium]|nr:cell division protein ZapE [Gammaproteobacteria bacterium]
MTPSKLFERAIRHDGYKPDPEQQAAIIIFQNVYDELTQNTASLGWLEKLLIKTGLRTKTRSNGIYLWGGVGRGKTWLMNLFFDSLPFEQKTRIHFHHFMIDVHQRLDALSRKGRRQKNPLNKIAADFARQYRVLCLDEFIVTNIVDAMILHRLLKSLNQYSVTLVMTSNRIPDDLYLNGLQRERFLPAIELIKQITHVIHLDGKTDHRASLTHASNVAHIKGNESETIKFEEKMHELVGDTIKHGHILKIHNRHVQTIACGKGVVWFDFSVLCHSPRAAQDYIQLAEQFHTLLLSNVPIMDEYMDDKARRFIYLIDALYDKRVKLILSAEAEPGKLYTGDMLKFAYRRTLSRLIEMQSEQYNQTHHRDATK